MRTRRLLLALVSAAFAPLAACGVNAQTAAPPSSPVQTPSETSSASPRALPPLPSGIVSIDGVNGSLTTTEVASYAKTGAPTQVDEHYRGEKSAYTELCAGIIDLADTTSPIDDQQLAGCRANGLDVVQLEIAASGVVMATRSETDTGADCLTTTQARDLYRAGSPVTGWSQLDARFDHLPTRVAGPSPATSAFALFDSLILSDPVPSLTTMRSDYHSFAGDDGTRTYVVGSIADQKKAALLPGAQRALALAESQLRSQQQIVASARANTAAAQQQLTTDQSAGVSAAQLAADQNAVYAAQGVLQGGTRWLPTYKKTVRKDRATVKTDTAAKKRLKATVGRVGLFGYSYYGLYEDQLRPLEISEPGTQNCIFPSQDTILSGTYPLAQRMLLTTTTRSLARPEVRSFLTHYLQHAQAEATHAQLVALRATDVTRELAWVDGRTAPDLVALATPVASASASTWEPAS